MRVSKLIRGVQLYGAAYMNPLVLNKEILDKYGVQTFVAKIGEAMKLPDGRCCATHSPSG